MESYDNEKARRAPLIAGGIAGAVSKTCTAPLSRMTILFQVQSTLRKGSYLHAVSHLLKEEGLRSFWRGNLTSVMHRIPYSAFNFYAYEYYKSMLFISSTTSLSVVDFSNIGISIVLMGFFLILCCCR